MTQRLEGHAIPKVTDWDYDVDHGLIRLASTEDLDRARPLISMTKVKVKDAVYNFQAFDNSELPSLVQLTLQLPHKGMLPETGQLAMVEKIMACTAEDNGWPKDPDTGSVKVLVVSVFWSAYIDGKGQPTGKGYWLIRFRVPVPVAEYIRTVQHGEINVISETFLVWHNREPWRGDRRAVLVHESDPVEVAS